MGCIDNKYLTLKCVTDYQMKLVSHGSSADVNIKDQYSVIWNWTSTCYPAAADGACYIIHNIYLYCWHKILEPYFFLLSFFLTETWKSSNYWLELSLLRYVSDMTLWYVFLVSALPPTLAECPGTWSRVPYLVTAHWVRYCTCQGVTTLILPCGQTHIRWC